MAYGSPGLTTDEVHALTCDGCQHYEGSKFMERACARFAAYASRLE